MKTISLSNILAASVVIAATFLSASLSVAAPVNGVQCIGRVQAKYAACFNQCKENMAVNQLQMCVRQCEVAYLIENRECQRSDLF